MMERIVELESKFLEPWSDKANYLVYGTWITNKDAMNKCPAFEFESDAKEYAELKNLQCNYGESNNKFIVGLNPDLITFG